MTELLSPDVLYGRADALALFQQFALCEKALFSQRGFSRIEPSIEIAFVDFPIRSYGRLILVEMLDEEWLEIRPGDLASLHKRNDQRKDARVPRLWEKRPFIARYACFYLA